MENDNKRLHEWFGLCWHQGGGIYTLQPCEKCGDKRFLSDRNPDYSTESGFFALLSGLRAKGFGVELRYQSENCLARLVKYAEIDADYDLDSPQTFLADTLPEALFQAALKAMTSEEKAD